MGEAPGVMRPDDPDRRIDAARTDDATAADDPDEIRDEIEATRANMSETIDEIQDRLNPDALKAQAKDAVRDATIGRAQEAMENVSDRAQYMMSSTGGSVIDTVRQNPVPAALAGIGLGWLWMNRSKGGTQQSYYKPRRHTTLAEGRYYATPGFDRYAEREQRYMSQPGHGESSKMDEAMHAVSNATDAVQEKAGHMTEQMSYQASHLGDQASEWGDQAQERMADARTQMSDMFQQSPLVAGLIAVGAGMAIGMLVPETQKENELMGEARDQIVEQAQSKAQDVVEKVQTVAQDAADSAKQSAEQQGMTASS